MEGCEKVVAARISSVLKSKFGEGSGKILGFLYISFLVSDIERKFGVECSLFWFCGAFVGKVGKW